MELVYLSIGALLGGIIGYLVALIRRKPPTVTSSGEPTVLEAVHQTTLQRVQQLQEQLETKEIECLDLSRVIGEREQIIVHQKKRLGESQAETHRLQEQLRLEFSATANQLLEEKSQKFTAQNQDNLNAILQPLEQRIHEFKQQIAHFYGDESKERASLKEQIRHLTSLNQQMSQDAQNLTRALKGDTKMQGDWGELILERLLEKAGLRAGSEYLIQQSYTTAEGRRLRPDLILQLPNQKQLIVDSKMSLTAYERFSNAPSNEAADRALRDHLTSVRNHVRELSTKQYQRLPQLNTLDFVLMFVPLEAAYALALQNDQELFFQAFEQNVLIVSPLTLLPTTKTIANLWQQEHQNRNAVEIADKAGKLYDKFVGFVEDVEKIGERIAQAEQSYQEALKKLHTGRGNLIRRATQLKTLGAKASKQIPTHLLDDLEDETNEPDSLLEE